MMTRTQWEQLRPPFRRTFVAALLLVAVPACMVGPDYSPPEAPMQDDWSGAEDEAVAQLVAADEVEIDLSDWWHNLADDELTALIARAIDSNLEIQLADARLREAIALRRGAYAELLPSIGLDSDYVHQRVARPSEDADTSPSATISQSLSNITGLGTPTANIRLGDNSISIRPPEDGQGVPSITASRSRTFGGDGGGFQRDRNSYQTLLGATWEIDVFGGLRRGVEAADAEIQASLEDRRAIQVSIAAEVARNYILLRGLQRLLEVTLDNIRIQRDTLNSIQSRFAASLATGTDVLQAQTQLKRTESEVPPLEAGIRETMYRLSVLVGQPPDHLVEELEVSQPLPSHPELMSVGLPSELLRRRPDIRAAERRLAAETARIGVEVAELFPRFSLTGSFGLQTAEFRDYVDRDSLTWAFGPNVRWRLVEFGRILSAIEVQEQRQRQALLLYQQIVLGALEQVESSMANYVAARRRTIALEQVNEVNRRAFEMAKSEYAVGMLNFLSVLDTQRSLFATQTELIQSQQRTLTELVNVYEALGGGWPDSPGA